VWSEGSDEKNPSMREGRTWDVSRRVKGERRFLLVLSS